MQPTMTMTVTATATDDADDAPENKASLAEKILMMTGEELALFIYLAKKELGLRFD